MRIFFLYLALVLSACGTTPINTPPATGPTIIFTRDSGFQGSGCTHYFDINGKEVTYLERGQSSIIRVVPGKYKLRFRTASGLCGSETMNLVVEVGNEPVVVRSGSSGSMAYIFNQVE